MNPVVVWIDKEDVSLMAVAEENSETLVDSTPLAAEIGLAAALLTSVAAAINVATAAMNSRVTRSTNVIKVNGRKYDLTPENRDKIMAAIDEHFQS